jgi:hypothetical protein
MRLRPLGVFLAVLATLSGAFVACGGTDDGNVDLVADAATLDVIDPIDSAVAVEAGTDAATARDAFVADTGGDADDAGDDARRACTPATVGTDCPPLACQFLTGCVGNVCQYAPAGACVARSFSGTFVTGAFEATVDTTSVRGEIGPFLQEQGATCVATTCVTGDLLP